ncbi:MAG: hypothetical protein OK474_12430 [Thaumarchaeota archaeon]|nr:hypothetical protein [Nitrososphaerota archaeon]
MRWSSKFIIGGTVIFLIGLLPPIVAGVTIGTLESAASFFATGILVLLIGMMIRKLQESFG